MEDDRTINDVSEGDPWFVRSCREAAGRMDADIAEVQALVVEKLMAWHAEGWLELTKRDWRMGDRGLVKTISRQTPEAAANAAADCVRDSMVDVFSMTALEAREVAQ